jgi:hypothetical protein
MKADLIKCNNWAKRTNNGRMLGYWPGSAVHQRATLENTRFEDFDYTSLYEGKDDDAENAENSLLAWMGNGMVLATQLNESTTGYLDVVDIPPLPRSYPAMKSPVTDDVVVV